MGRNHRTERGKIASLVALIDEHGEALEADLQWRGVDLCGLWRGDFSWRKLGVLVAALPPESLTKTALREALTPEQLAELPEPDGHGPWSRTDHLLAALVDRASLLVWQQTQINGGKRTQPPPPLPRPGVEPVEGKRRVSAAGIAYLADLRERRRARNGG